MDILNPIVALCQQGSLAEFKGQPAAAAEAYQQAWNLSSDHYEAAVAAHYLARTQPDVTACHSWNALALEQAQLAESQEDLRVQELLPSLWLSLAGAERDCGQLKQARHCFEQAVLAAKKLSGPVGEMFCQGLATHELRVLGQSAELSEFAHG